ncbi:RcnB family protein [Asticcacaulis solisilvae]|uniref:RcnB family protein n=1 Tax=Asticcacaulis solisilvae TaxID=1217274 RepID=UPI003FD7771D
MTRTLTSAAALCALASTVLFTGTSAMAKPHHGWHDHSDWRRGGYVARSDWDRGQHVDYRAHHLRAPPRGYEWRQVDGRYVLAAVASGVIASIILNSH